MSTDGQLIDPHSLRGLTDMLERLGEDGRQSAAFATTHTAIPWTGEGIINLLSGGHEVVRSAVERFFRDVEGRVAVPAADLVRWSVGEYVRTDQEVAAALPGAGEALQGTVTAPTDAAFRDVVDPAARLRPPPDHEAEYPHEPLWVDIASPGALLRDAIWTVTGAAAGLGILDRAYDPYEWLLKPVVGDWAAVRGCADVFTALADAAADMSRNADAAGTATTTVWTGEGAQACVDYLSSAADGLGRAQQPLREVAAVYVGAAQGMHQLRSALAALLNDIADAAIMAAASAAVVALAGSTGVGLPIALVVGAFTLSRIYAVARGLLRACDRIALTIAALAAQASAFESFGHIGGIGGLPALPTPG
jgi:hypothetical protein